MLFVPWPRRRRRPSRADAPFLEVLEARLAPAGFVVTDSGDSGPGTLRQAILDANAIQGPDSISFALPPGTTIALNSPLTITDDLSITGPGATQLTLDGQHATQLISVVGVNSFSLSGLTLANGQATGANGAAVQLAANPVAVSFQGVSFQGNSATGNGGAVDTPGTSQLAFTDCTFDGNSSGSQGGAVSVGVGTVSVTDCTFSNNSAARQGGAINSNFAANYTLTDCTIADNSAGFGGGISVTGGSVSLYNTIVAGNTAPSSPDVFGPVTSDGYNLIQDLSGATLGGSAPGDVFGKPAMLLPLGLYGGETETRPPVPTSPAVNAGRPIGEGDVDQRGVYRGSFGFTDIGAVHLYTVTVFSTADSGEGTLRDALNLANSRNDPVRILFQIYNPAGGVPTIQPLPSRSGVALPVITNRVFLDGWSQGGSGPQGQPQVEIDGSQTPGTIGLNLQAPDSVIRGFALNRFAGAGGFGLGLFNAAADDWIYGNDIGTTPDGQSAAGNGQGGLWLGAGVSGVRIGTDGDGVNDQEEANVISGNGGPGVRLDGASNTVAGNTIGLAADGAAPLGNAGDGILVTGSGNAVGGTFPVLPNVITANGRAGVHVTGKSATGEQIVGNLIGFARDGTASQGNGTAGVLIDGTAADVTVGPDDRIAGSPVGVLVAAGSFGVTVTQSSVTATGGPAIDRGGDGPTAAGRPVLLTASPDNTGEGPAESVTGYATGSPGETVTVELFASPTAGGPYQGARFVGETTVTIGPNGRGDFTATVDAPAADEALTATATDPQTGDTSEFSPGPPVLLTATAATSAQVGAVFGGSFQFTARDAFGAPVGGVPLTFSVPSTGPSAVLPFTQAETDPNTGAVTLSGVQANTVPGGYQLRADGPGGLTTALPLSNEPGPAASFTITGLPQALTAGTPSSVTVTAFDQYGNVATGYTGTVHFTSNDPQAVLPADYTFTTADSGTHAFPGLILKSAGPRSVAVTDTANAALTGSQSDVTVSPAAAATLTLSPLPAAATAGEDVPVTVTLFDAYGNVATGDRSTVQFASGDGRADLPAAYTFTAADNGTHQFTVRFRTATTSVTLTVTDGPLTATEATRVNPAAAAFFTLDGLGLSLPPGRPQAFTLTAHDQFGNVATDYAGTVTITSSDPRATLPGPVTFGPADGGELALSVTFRTSGQQSLTAGDGSISGSLMGITVLPGPRLVLQAPGSVGLGTPFTLTLLVVDDAGNPVTDFLGTVDFGGARPGGLPASYTFTTADLGRHEFNLIPLAPGPAALTVSDADQIAQSGNLTVQVNDILPGIRVETATPTMNVGSPFTLSGTFLYPVPSLLTATVTVGDGPSVPLAVGPDDSFSFQSTFADEASFPVTVRVSNPTGAGASFTVEVHVLLPGITETEAVGVAAGQTQSAGVTGASGTLQHGSDSATPAFLVISVVPEPVARALAPAETSLAQTQADSYDVRVVGAGADDLLTLTFSYPTPADPNTTPSLMFFDPRVGAYVDVKADSVVVDRVHHTVTFILGADTTPSVLNLNRTVFLLTVSGPAPAPVTPFVQVASLGPNVTAPVESASEGPATRGFSSGSSQTLVLVGRQAGQPDGDSGAAEVATALVDAARTVFREVVDNVRQRWDEIAEILNLLRTMAAPRPAAKPPAPPLPPATTGPQSWLAEPIPLDGIAPEPAPEVVAVVDVPPVDPPADRSAARAAPLLVLLAGAAALAHDAAREKARRPVC